MNNNLDPRDPRRYRSNYAPYGEPEIKRTYTPEEAGHDKHRKPVTRASYNTRRRKRKKPNVGVIVIISLFVLVAAACIWLLLSGNNNPENIPDNDKHVPLGSEKTEDELLEEIICPDTDDPNDNKEELLPYFTVTLTEDDIHMGDLILVNSYHEYLFPEEMEKNIVKISDHNNGYYGTSAYNTAVYLSGEALNAFNKMTEDNFNDTGFKWLQVNSAYRSLEHQQQLYSDYLRDYGQDYVDKYVATPGYSEHHTGLGIDLNVNRNGSISYVESDAECGWFREKCQEYGFVLRYPDDKIHITGIDFESWHYRYVGVPHAQIMEDLNLCLEEYVDYLKTYTFDGECLSYSAETGIYQTTAEEFYKAESGIMIYYVPADAENGETEVSIPKDCEYTVSGNNVDGYIITCEK